MTVCNVETLAMWQRYARLKLSLSLYQCLPWQQTAAQQSQFAAQLARQWQLEHAIREQAAQRGIRADENGMISAQYVLRTFFDDEPAWLTALQQAGIDDAGLRQALAHEATLTAMLDAVAGQTPPVGDSEVEAWYQQHRHRFQQPEKRLAHHLLLVIDDEQADSTRDIVAERMATLQRRLQIDPRRFARLATRFSACPTALEGGKLGWIKRGMLYPELDAMLFSMEAGTFSPSVETTMGLHILWCEAIRPAGETPKAQAQIREQWQETRRRQYQRQWLAAISAR
ncbi:peptidyl-prolyl cis-trans isomerase C|uniref:peptidylprolyl isomerase n=1 Tax=Brenneria salicis ATCC 15712 = DSM 30166 TaxID=714314 RepID=A0A366I8D4_9GAMM|nr:nitrogen fixation protein NifM [Brenneria salicis]NMN91739.1 peptidyl-prolyl cis-trans isomerase C [Brenneria salicis ATCC 15712 = DSM 30166]RBP65797.1 peptidyl-prolyl cis-trans isomerase C [Brenneria salicis ATCC 15712 = DSM 30166]RLM31836.1 nitrogen fixation protein NifM [Brenneria salicis ATCC 15712 = DSM 30166]